MSSSRSWTYKFSFGGARESLTKKENIWLYAVLFLVLNLIIKSNSITKVSFDLDEAWHTFFSQKGIKEIFQIAGTDPNGPFFNVLLHFWIKLFGVSEVATRSLSLIFSAATAPLIFLLGKKYFNSLTGIFAALIFSFSNLHFFFSHNARVYSLICFLATLSVLLFFRLIKTQKRTTFVYLTIVNTILLYTHLTTSFFIVAEGLATLLFFSESKKGTLLVVGSQALSAILFAPWVLLTPYYNQPVHGVWLNPPTWENVKLVLYDFCSTKHILKLFIALFVLSFIVRKRDSWQSTWKLQLVLFLWFCVPLLLSVASSHFLVPVFQTKYVMTSSLGLFLLIAYSISLLRIGSFLKFIIISYLVIKLYPSMGWYEFITEDWRSAVSEVKKLKTEKTAVIVSPWYMNYPFCYYYNREYYKDTKNMLDLLNKERIFFGEKKEMMLQKPTDYNQVILLTTHEKMISPESIIGYLRNNLLPECDTAFPSIRMYCFKKSGTANFATDMETSAQSFRLNNIVEKGFAHSGGKVSMLDGQNAYSATFEDKAGTFSKQSTFIVACGWVFYEDKNTDCSFVVSFENSNGFVLYDATEIMLLGPPNKWFRMCRKIKIPAEVKSDDIVKVYFWNKTKNPVYVDDMEVIEAK